jgi:hypothetical protein
MRRTIFALAAAFAMSGCSAMQTKTVAEDAVNEFHQLLNAGRYHDIWQGAADEFRDSTPEGVVAGMFRYDQLRLGNFAEAHQSGWHVNYHNGVTTVDLNYDSRFALGNATEAFVYVMRDGRAQLLSYEIHSDNLRRPPPGTPAPQKPAAPMEGGGK